MNVVEQVDGNAQAPMHIPTELVVDFDYLGDARLQPDLHDGFGRLLKDAPPLFYTPRNGGHWVATRGEDIYEIFKDAQRFTSQKLVVPAERNTHRMPPIFLDPPEHTKYRTLLSPLLSP